MDYKLEEYKNKAFYFFGIYVECSEDNLRKISSYINSKTPRIVQVYNVLEHNIPSVLKNYKLPTDFSNCNLLIMCDLKLASQVKIIVEEIDLLTE